ncbi:hypothetical protein Psch_03075 [Pelotomaculum schinkii]|uniref:Uncharacterized protein n=1 Tax=Pelotomaculum schinkii TaxID=78350 RepID=A0A4Y7RBD3_9FIRM|nr:hypothetical protein Psch_03075 [Pelotomaculum schinkii]
MKADKYLLLTFKRLLWIIGAWIAAVFLHNAIYALFYSFFSETNGDEPVFFIIAVVVIPLYFVISLIYTVFRKFSKH